MADVGTATIKLEGRAHWGQTGERTVTFKGTDYTLQEMRMYSDRFRSLKTVEKRDDLVGIQIDTDQS